MKEKSDSELKMEKQMRDAALALVPKGPRPFVMPKSYEERLQDQDDEDFMERWKSDRDPHEKLFI